MQLIFVKCISLLFFLFIPEILEFVSVFNFQHTKCKYLYLMNNDIREKVQKQGYKNDAKIIVIMNGMHCNDFKFSYKLSKIFNFN